MKKMLAILLALLMVLMAGCGGASERSAPENNAAGLYLCTGGTDENGDDMTSMLDTLSALGLYFTLELREDGTGVLDLAGDQTELTWSKSSITMEGVKNLYTLDGDTLSLKDGKESLVFTRISAEEMEAKRKGLISEEGEILPDDSANMVPGVYYVTDCSKDGEAAYLSDEYLRIENDGTGVFGLLGSEYSFEWTLSGTSFTFTDEEGDTFDGVYDGTVIAGDYYSGYHYVFELMDEPPEDFGHATAVYRMAGNYQLVAVFDEAQGDLTAYLDPNDPITMELRQDGTGTMYSGFDDGSESLELEWDEYTIVANGEAVSCSLEDGNLVLSDDETRMVFAPID